MSVSPRAIGEFIGTTNDVISYAWEQQRLSEVVVKALMERAAGTEFEAWIDDALTTAGTHSEYWDALKREAARP